MQGNDPADFTDGGISTELSIEDIEKSMQAMNHHDLLSYATNINKKLDELYKVIQHGQSNLLFFPNHICA